MFSISIFIFFYTSKEQFKTYCWYQCEMPFLSSSQQQGRHSFKDFILKDESVKQLSSARFSKKVLKRFKWMDWLEKWMCWLLFVSSSCTQDWSLCAAWIILSLNKILHYEEHIEHFSLLFKCCNQDLLFSIKENHLFKLIWILCKISVKQKDQRKETSD